MKTFLTVLVKSPFVAVQIAIYVYMTLFGIGAIFQIFSNHYFQWIYAMGILYNLGLTLVALYKTIQTEPGCVSSELIEKLKNQLLLPR